MEGGGMSANDILENKGVRLLYFAVLLVLVLLVVWHLKSMNDRASKKTERMENLGLGLYGMTESVDNSGANVRFKSEPTSETQGKPETPKNADLQAAYGVSRKDKMTAWRESPAFWDYSLDENNAASASQFLCSDASLPRVEYNAATNQYMMNCADGSVPKVAVREKEHQTNPNTITQIQDAILSSGLY
jgi:hypothetical protein